jgi:hypothetical protein
MTRSKSVSVQAKPPDGSSFQRSTGFFDANKLIRLSSSTDLDSGCICDKPGDMIGESASKSEELILGCA